MKDNGITIDRPIGWTTLEEAKELRKLGLEKGTNDLWYIKPYFPEYMRPTIRREMTKKEREKVEKIISPIRESCFDIPAWSLGALIAILPSWIVIYDKNGICYDAYLKITNGSALYEYRNGEEYVQLWKIVSDFQITAVIGMIRFMLSHPDILEMKAAYL